MSLAARSIPFNVLAPGVQAIRSELDAAIARVLESGWFLMGPELKRFEADFSAYHGAGFLSVGVGSGTDAIRIGLEALGIHADDEVLCPANAGVPPVAAIVATGARPVFCDVDPATHGLDPGEIDRRMTPRCKAVLVVHLYGQPASIEQIADVARSRGIRVLEDCAQAHGAEINGHKVGTFGDAAAFSFYPTKNLGALGDGGAILTSDREVAERARALRMYGWRQQYVSECQATVSRLDELQAAVLSVKLTHLDEWNARRRALAARYRSQLPADVDVLPSDGVFHLFVIRTSRRDELRAYLADHGIGTGIHYPLPAHLQKPYVGYASGPLPQTEALAREVLSLPMYPELAQDDVDYVAQQVRAFFEAH
jgi:dTDP-4-amino-4,6-dideoxygalactose transaminase